MIADNEKYKDFANHANILTTNILNRNTFVIALLLTIQIHVFAQQNINNVMCNKYTLCSQQGSTAISSSKTGLASIDKSFAYFSFSQDYCLNELWNAGAHYAWKNKTGCLPINIICKGPSYNTNIELSTDYSLFIFNNFAVSAGLISNYNIIKSSNNLFSAGCELGMQYSYKKITIGMYAKYPALFHKKTDISWSDLILETALSYKFFEKGSINIGFRKQQFSKLEFIANFISQITKKCYMMVAYNSASGECCCGLTYMTKKINITLNAALNINIGVTPSIGIQL